MKRMRAASPKRGHEHKPSSRRAVVAGSGRESASGRLPLFELHAVLRDELEIELAQRATTSHGFPARSGKHLDRFGLEA